MALWLKKDVSTVVKRVAGGSSRKDDFTLGGKNKGYNSRFCCGELSGLGHNTASPLDGQSWIHGRVSDVVIRPLNEERAVELAAHLFSELFLLSVVGLAIMYEVRRSSRSEALKEERRKQDLEALKQKDAANMKEVEALKIRLNDLERQLRQKSWRDTFLVRYWP